MGNVFDQFDEKETNVFDQFDAPEKKPAKQTGVLDVLGAHWKGHAAAAEPLAHLGSSLVAAPIAGLAGIAGAVLPGEQGQGNRWLENVQNAMTYQPRIPAGQQATDAVTYPLRKYAEFADAAGGTTPTTSFAKSPEQRARDLRGPSPLESTASNVIIQAAPSAFIGRPNVASSPRVGVRPLARESKPTPANPNAQRPPGLGRVPEVAPSLEELSTRSSAAYKRASDAGVMIAPDSFAGLQSTIGAALKKEGLNAKLHPSASAAFEEIASKKGALSLDELETLRKIANDAKGSQVPADSRLVAS